MRYNRIGISILTNANVFFVAFELKSCLNTEVKTIYKRVGHRFVRMNVRAFFSCSFRFCAVVMSAVLVFVFGCPIQ